MTDTGLSYPISAPGYIDTPGRAGNYVHIDRTALIGTVNTVEWIVRFRMDTSAAQTLLGWGSNAARLVIGTDLKVTMFVNNAGGSPIGNVASAIFPNLFANIDLWLRAKLTVANAKLEYWYSFDKVDPQWSVLGEVFGTNAGTVVNVANSTPFNIGVSASAGPTPLDGRIHFVQENINDVPVLRFDANEDLRGITFDATSFAVSLPATTPVTQATVTRDASTPKLILVQPSLERPWWPQSDQDDPARWYRYPAFTVQRDILGGDTVRGSTSAAVEKTALRFPVEVAAPEVIQGKGILFTRVYDYETVQIQWGLPEKFTDNWYQAAIVRSAFGYPITVTDGQVVHRMTKSEVFPNGQPTGSITFADVYDMVGPPKGSHTGLPSGYWYYYSLFFQAGRRWYRSMVSSSLVPRNYGHSDHLFNALPPYYRWVDDQQNEQGGDLRRFLKVFGFDLDTTREYVESWQKLYWIDFAPMRLLRRLGPNFDLPYEAGIGDVRYRALLADMGYLYSIRGTQNCLEKVVEAVSKCECGVTGSSNLLLLPDDSDFFEGPGHWAGLHTGTSLSTQTPPVTALAPEKVVLHVNTVQQVPPPSSNNRTYGRGTASVWTDDSDALIDVVLTIGDGTAYPLDDANLPITDQPRHITPRESAIHVTPKGIYGFSVWLQHEQAAGLIDTWLMWFSGEGQPDDLISITKDGKIAPLDTNWKEWNVIGEAPTNAVFCVPAVHFSSRPAAVGAISRKVNLSGASFYLLGSPATVSRIAPDKYLTLGSELIGAPTTSPPFEGFVMGAPED
jgi:hypothetical protein